MVHLMIDSAADDSVYQVSSCVTQVYAGGAVPVVIGDSSSH
jgi:hypothetical protein